MIIGTAAAVVGTGLAVTEAYASTSIDAFTAVGAPNALLSAGAEVLNDSNATFQEFQVGANGISFSASNTSDLGKSWSATITPPTGGTLAVGSYDLSATADATHAAVDLTGDGKGCTATGGTFAVTQLTRDAGTQALTAFAATYHVQCGSPAEVAGEMRWHSTVDYVGAVAPPGLPFSFQPVNFDGTPQDLVITGAGTTPLHLGAASLGGTAPTAFRIQTDGCAGKTVAAGQTCSVTVVPHPTTMIMQTATLTIPDNSAAGQLVMGLSTTGTTAVASASIAPTSLAFGSVPLGQTPTRTVTVTATGNVPLTMTTVFVNEPSPHWFTVSADHCTGVLLAPGHQCTVTVAGSPLAMVTHTASLIIQQPNPTVSFNIPLSATGTEAESGTYYPVTPQRVLDTRTGVGAPVGALGPQGVLHLQVTGAGGVPASGVSAVVLNVTVTGPTASSYLSVYPTGLARPAVSSLNFPAGWTGANNVTVPVGQNGQVDIFNNAGSTHVIADVMGFYSADNSVIGAFGFGGEYQPAQPLRLIDTRSSGTGPVGAGASMPVAVDFGMSINPHVRALAVNITAVSSGGTGYFTAWNGVDTRPVVSTLNFTPHTVVPNMAIVPAAPCAVTPECAGLPSIAVYNGSSQPTHLIVDIFGVFDDGTLDGGLTFRPIHPIRITDTRSGIGAPHALGPKATVSITYNQADVRTAGIAANVTAVAPSAATFITVWPTGLTRPTVSTLNATAGQVVPNAAIITIGTGEQFNVFNNSGTMNVIVDVAGVFEAAGNPNTLDLPLSGGQLVGRAYPLGG
jgi:hypothetical protein